jgi:hypothetical protein
MKIEITKSSNSALSESARRDKIRLFIKQGLSGSPNGRILDEMKSKINHFESIYSIPSSELENAITAGRIKETDEIVQWVFAYHMLERASRV